MAHVDLPADVERVTGPEAERLILAIHRWIAEQANEQNLSFEEFVRKGDAAARAEQKKTK